MTTPAQPPVQPNGPQQDTPTERPAVPSPAPAQDAAPKEESSEYRSARRKKIFAGLSFGLVIILILAITTFVDNRPGSRALPSNSILGFWTSFCPAHNTIVADADAISIQKGESTEKYLDRLRSTLERQAADFRDAALQLSASSVMMNGSEKQKKDLQNLVDVLREGDKVFTERAKQLRAHPIRTQAEMDELAAALKSVYDRYSKAVSKATSAIGMGDKKTRERIENLSECKQLLVQQSPQPTTTGTSTGSASDTAEVTNTTPGTPAA